MFKNLLYLFFLEFVFAVHIEYVEAYFGHLDMLNRPKINKDGSIISAEIYTITANQMTQWDDKIILFKKYTDNLSSHKGYIIKSNNNRRHYAGRVLWSNENEKWFLSIEKKKDNIIQNNTEKYGENIVFHNIKSTTSDLDIYTIREHPQLQPYYGINDTDTYMIKQFKMKKFDPPADYNHGKFPIPNEIIFYLYRNYDQNTILKSNHPDYEEYDQYVFPKNFLPRKPISNFDMVQQYDSLAAPQTRSFNLTFEVNEIDNQNTVYFSCFTDITNRYNTHIPLYPIDIDMPQKEALFNAKGTKIAFLNYEENKKGSLPDLYTVDISECKDCLQFSEDYNNDTLTLDYQKVDSNIVDQEWYGDDSPIFTSYCWHPNKNILFYVKRTQNTDDGSNKYPIYYYDLDSSKGPVKMDILTNYNKDLSISQDGDYLLFSFSGMRDYGDRKVSEKTYFRNSNDEILYGYTANPIGVAKLIYD